jgi:chlorobactene glucosyltransferase
MIHALLVVGAVATVLAAVVLPVNLAAIPPLSRTAKTLPASRCPRVSVVIPARDEEGEIERAVRSHLSQDYPDVQVVVVDDRSRDRTPEILAALAREDRRLIVVEGTDPPEGWLGKPHALWQGARVADGEILLFADADVRYDRRALREEVAVLEGRDLDLVAFFPRLEMRGFWENVLLPYLSVGVFLGLGFLAVRPRFKGLALGAGVGNLVRRRVYDAVGGHEALRDSVIDDVHLAIAVKRGGFRVGVFRADDRIAVRIYRGFRGVWDGFTKNVAWAFPGAGGAVLFALTLVLFAASVAPAATLLAAGARAPVASADVRLAAVVFAGSIVVRASLAAALGDPLWPAPTHPIMTAVWAGLLGRSLFHRFVRKRLTWRGREYDARRARF